MALGNHCAGHCKVLAQCAKVCSEQDEDMAYKHNKKPSAMVLTLLTVSNLISAKTILVNLHLLR